MELEEYRLVHYYKLTGQYKEAIQLCFKILEQYPNQQDVLTCMGEAYGSLGKKDEAYKCYNDALKLDPHNSSLWHEKGMVCAKLGDEEEALICYNTAITLNPYNPNYYYDKGRTLHSLKREEEARLCDILYNKCITTKITNDLLSWFCSGVFCPFTVLDNQSIDFLNIDSHSSRLWVKKGDIKEDAGDKKVALRFYKKAVEISPNRYDIWYRMGEIAIQMRKFDEAIKYYGEVLKLYPLYEAYINKGMSYLMLDQNYKALHCFDKAIELNPLRDEGWINKGYLLYRLHHLSGAEMCYLEAIKINPRNAYAWLNCGVLLYHLNRQSKALEYNDTVTLLEPNNYKGWFNKGHLYWLFGDKKNAKQCFCKAMELSMDNVSFWSHSVFVNLFLRLESYNEALICARNIVDRAPSSSNWFFLGVTYEESGKYNNAIDCFNKAIKLKPSKAVYWNAKGCCLEVLDRLNQSESCFRQAVKLAPNDPAILYNVGTVLSYNDQYSEAISFYDKAVEILASRLMDFHNLENKINDVNQLSDITQLELANVLSRKGIVLIYLKRNQEALECFNEAIKLNENESATMANLGYAYYKLEKLDKAVEYCNKALSIDSLNEKYWDFKGMVSARLGKYSEAVKDFLKAGIDILGIIHRLSSIQETDIFYDLLDQDPFFKKATENIGDKSKLAKYKKLYIYSLRIINLLYVDKDEENQVAHYTKAQIAKKLLFENAIFRLSTVATANDTNEGNVLLNYLFSSRRRNHSSLELFDAFIGCFTFNSDSLNQFRLYGKTNGEEGTGVSIIIGKHFFNNYKRENIPYSLCGGKLAQYKLPLYRCIYIDPTTNYIVSVGQKEESSIYRDVLNISNGNKELAEEVISNYRAYIQEIIDNVRIGLNNMKSEVLGLDRTVVQRLLINLRYLCKNASYKEEQECRIFRIESLNSKEIIRTDCEHKHINYINVDNYVKQICFGPRAKEIDIFKDELKKCDLNVDCYMSDHPFTSD